MRGVKESPKLEGKAAAVQLRCPKVESPPTARRTGQKEL